MKPPADQEAAPLALSPAPPPGRTLHRLFLKLFLRGRGSRGPHKESAPRSVGSKLAFSLIFYGLFGMVALAFLRQPLFALSVYLHAMTFMLLGLFVAASAGEVLFNKDEADILLHRPVTPRVLLRAKIGVLVQVSFWLAGALNLAGFIVGAFTPDGSWLFPVAHAMSTATQALFCTACVVLAYQLCLRWFGRERLEGLMTTVQVLMAVAAVLGGQVAPRIIGPRLNLHTDQWWINLLPPAWFAGFDDALAGRHASGSWVLAAIAVLATATVLWLALGKLARDYASDLQTLNETVTRLPRQRCGRRWFDMAAHAPPLRWWLRDPVARASFLLTAAYLVRDRDTKLRIYPGVAPMLVMPLIFLFQGGRQRGFGGSAFGVAFSGAYLGLVPLLALGLLQYSQQWKASDCFRAAPLPGPGRLCSGAKRAVSCFLTLPVLAGFGLVIWLIQKDHAQLPLLLPGVIAVPLYSLIPFFNGRGVPLSLPTEEARLAGRGLTMIAVTLASLALAGIAVVSWLGGWFWWLLLVEAIAVIGSYVGLRAALARTPWSSSE